MAKVVITIEDTLDGKVKVVAEPNFETMMHMDLSGNKLTSAHGIAFFTLNTLWKEMKHRDPTKLLVPKVKRIN